MVLWAVAPMKTLSLELKLLSPAFLGNATQRGQWRTPPLKALLREWWRVLEWNRQACTLSGLRQTEGDLFGAASDEGGNSRKSRVRLALGHWHEGKMTTLENDAKVPHGEVKFPVGSQLYLGYGPIIYDKASKKTTLKHNAALQAGEPNTLDLAWPDNCDDTLKRTLQLIHWFGTFGGRSRNGWGSLALGGRDAWHPEPLTATGLQYALRPLEKCLELDWPHAIGQDGKGALVWESAETFADWKEAMKFLAKTKIGFRTRLGFTTGKNSRLVEPRHIVAYPVTNHDLQAWGGQVHLANQLRFKLFHDAENQLRVRIYHTPHQCPLPSGMSPQQERAVWQAIHSWLDDPQARQANYQELNLQRLGAGS
jgi:CRISPR-associated protein Cmr1